MTMTSVSPLVAPERTRQPAAPEFLVRQRPALRWGVRERWEPCGRQIHFNVPLSAPPKSPQFGYELGRVLAQRWREGRALGDVQVRSVVAHVARGVVSRLQLLI